MSKQSQILVKQAEEVLPPNLLAIARQILDRLNKESSDVFRARNFLQVEHDFQALVVERGYELFAARFGKTVDWTHALDRLQQTVATLVWLRASIGYGTLGAAKDKRLKKPSKKTSK